MYLFLECGQFLSLFFIHFICQSHKDNFKLIPLYKIFICAQSKAISSKQFICIIFQLQKNRHIKPKYNIIDYMGGNAFEDTQKLTPEQYGFILAKIQTILQPICQVIEPYIPMPEKSVHGDIDFLLIFKEGYTLEDIRVNLEIEKQHFIRNNNQTANSVYMKKQIDFNSVKNEHEFALCMFYKSYGGIGAFLGLFLPSKFIKLNQTGIVCCAYEEHIKLEFLVCDKIQDILNFYGLDYKRYKEGFKTRLEIFQYLRNLKFLNENELLEHTTKHQTKLMVAFQDFVKQSGAKINPHYVKWQNPILQTLKHFNRQEEFDKSWNVKLQAERAKKQRGNKWNGLHIMNIFKVNSKSVNSLKKIFESTFKTRTEYEQYIDITPFQQIISHFSKICNIQPQNQ